MALLARHIRTTVILSMITVLALITALDVLFVLIDELGDTGGDYTVVNALIFVALIVPTSIYELLPFTALGGALIGLGILASNNELVVMQSAGVHNWRLVAAVLQPTLAVMLLSLALGEYVSPTLEQLANSNKALQLSGTGSINSELGTWRKVGDEFIYIDAIAPGGATLYGVTRYRVASDQRLSRASFAESGTFEREQDEAYWRLTGVRSSYFEGDSVRTTVAQEENWSVDLSPELLAVLLVEPDRQSISGLYRFARFSRQQGLDSADYFLAFWKKLLQPLATLALVLLAISFVFGPLREATMGFRVFIALATGLVFTILQRLMEPASLIYGFSPAAAVLLPIILAGGLGALLLRRVQ